MHRRQLIDILAGRDRTPVALALRAVLRLGVPFYAAAIAARNALFDREVCQAHDLRRPVISVGNLTTGGTGKTPLVIELARRVTALGAKPAVLLRGYTYRGAPLTDSDEARLLQSELGAAVPVLPNPDRVEGAQRVLFSRPDVTVFLLDDGFQHRRVRRDLDLVLLDATEPFGYGSLLPAGLLREPLRALRRADAVILTRADLATAEQIQAIAAQLERQDCPQPLARCASQWTGFRDIHDQVLPADALRQTPTAGVCGIGNPEQFATLLGRCAAVATVLPLADHQVYTAELLRDIFARAAARGAQAVVTTEKDWVKWRPPLATGNPPLPVYRPVLRTVFLEGEAAIDKLLREVVATPQQNPPLSRESGGG